MFSEPTRKVGERETDQVRFSRSKRMFFFSPMKEKQTKVLDKARNRQLGAFDALERRRLRQSVPRVKKLFHTGTTFNVPTMPEVVCPLKQVVHQRSDTKFG